MPRPSSTFSTGSRPKSGREFGHSDEGRWIKRYGFEEVTVGKPDDESTEDGRYSRRGSYRKTVRERPGLVPSALFHIISNTVFLRLSDVASGLPDYEEQVMLSSMDTEEDSTGYSQRTAYNAVFEVRLQAAAGDVLADASRLPGRLHQRGDRLRPQDRRRDSPGAAPLRGAALPQGEGAV